MPLTGNGTADFKQHYYEIPIHKACHSFFCQQSWCLNNVKLNKIGIHSTTQRHSLISTVPSSRHDCNCELNNLLIINQHWSNVKGQIYEKTDALNTVLPSTVEVLQGHSPTIKMYWGQAGTAAQRLIELFFEQKAAPPYWPEWDW